MKNKSKKNFVLSLYEFEKFHTKYKKIHEGIVGDMANSIAKEIDKKMKLEALKARPVNEVIKECDVIVQRGLREILEDVFFRSILSDVNIKYSFSINTAATNGVDIIFNPYFVLTLDKPQDSIHFLIMHELLHVVYGHVEKVGKRHGWYWNVACDLTINDTIVKLYNLGKPTIEGAWWRPEQYGSDKTSEVIYELILKDGSIKPDEPPPPPPPPPRPAPEVGQIVRLTKGKDKGKYGIITKIDQTGKCDIKNISKEEAKKIFKG